MVLAICFILSASISTPNLSEFKTTGIMDELIRYSYRTSSEQVAAAREHEKNMILCKQKKRKVARVNNISFIRKCIVLGDRF